MNAHNELAYNEAQAMNNVDASNEKFLAHKNEKPAPTYMRNNVTSEEGLPFDSLTALRTLSNTLAVRFVSAAERCYNLERAGKATLNDFDRGLNDDIVGTVESVDGLNEMSAHGQAQTLGAMWATINSAACEAADTKFDLPMKLADALSLITYGKVVDTADRKQAAPEALKALIARAREEAAATAQLLVDEGDISAEEATMAPDVAEQEARAEFNRRHANFDAVLGYVESVPFDVFLTSETTFSMLLNAYDTDTQQQFWERIHDKLTEAKDKLVARLLSSKVPAKAKANMRADLVLLRDDIKYAAKQAGV